jgi:hypothetical protein
VVKALEPSKVAVLRTDKHKPWLILQGIRTSRIGSDSLLESEVERFQRLNGPNAIKLWLDRALRGIACPVPVTSPGGGHIHRLFGRPYGKQAFEIGRG